MEAVHMENPYFSSLEVECITRKMTYHQYDRGQDILSVLGKESALLYVESGEIKMNMMAEDGRVLTLFDYRKGDFIGQVEWMYASHCELVTQSKTRVGAMSERQREALVRTVPGLAQGMLRWSEAMSQRCLTRIRDLLLYGKQGALASVLVRLMNTYGVKTNEGTIIQRRISNATLAMYIGTSREYVNRFLLDFRNHGILSFDGKYLVVHDEAFLRKQHDCLNCPVHICRI